MTARFVVVLASVLVCATAWLGPQLHAADPNRAGVVVQGGDGEVRKMCVAFTDDEITGFELLERTKLDLEVERGAVGNAVCKIGGDGCSSGDCFCRYPTFWGYWTRDDGERAWTFSDVGSKDRQVRDGSLDGWSWGRDGKPAPPRLSFGDVCAAASGQNAQPTSRARISRPDYAPFAALVVLVAAGGSAAYVLRRRHR